MRKGNQWSVDAHFCSESKKPSKYDEEIKHNLKEHTKRCKLETEQTRCGHSVFLNNFSLQLIV